MEELESYQLIDKRVEILERSHYKSLQYNRHELIEISGISDTVPDKELENKTLEILDSIGVGKVEPWQVHACHRLKNKKNTIIRFTSNYTSTRTCAHHSSIFILRFGNYTKINSYTIITSGKEN